MLVRKCLTFSILSAGLVLNFISAAALAENNALFVVNGSQHSIEAILVSRDDAEDWGPNRLSGLLLDRVPPILGEGEGVKIELFHFGDYCFFDVRIVDDSGDYRDYDSLNLCRDPEIQYE